MGGWVEVENKKDLGGQNSLKSDEIIMVTWDFTHLFAMRIAILSGPGAIHDSLEETEDDTFRTIEQRVQHDGSCLGAFP